MVALAAVLALPGGAHAQNSCNGFVSIAYGPSTPPFSDIGQVVTVRLTLGTGQIQGGSTMTVHNLRFELDCDSDFALGLNCTDDGAVIEYQGDSTINTNCPATAFASGHPVSDLPNQVVFTPTPALVIPAYTPNFCFVEFDVKVIGLSNDGTPQEAEEVGGYSAAGTGDATCNNGLKSSGSQSASIDLCPVCNDSACAAFVCNNQTGECDPVPEQPSTPCPDLDGDQCTIPGCDGFGDCNQMHNNVVCPPDTNPCTDPPFCDPSNGMCVYPFTPSSTPCPDTDSDTCTVSGCDGNGNCNQTHIPCTTTTTTTSTSTTSTTLCGNSILEGSEQCDPPGPASAQCNNLRCEANCQCCIPTPEDCDNMVDDDCDGLVDCDDVADCPLPCPPILKDPSTIRFGKNGGLDRFDSHGRVEPENPVDMGNSDVGWVLSNNRGVIWSGTLSPSQFRSTASGNTFRYTNPAARTQGGIFRALIRITRQGTSYGYKVRAYGDMSAATDADMSIQFYLGNPPEAYIHSELWTRNAAGWKADGFD
jgi:hypothetical protein